MIQWFLGRWMRCAIPVLFLAGALSVDGAEKELPLLRAGAQSFTNVIVTRQTDTHLFIMHDGGMATVKIAELDPAAQAMVGVKPKRTNAAAPGAPSSREGNPPSESAIAGKNSGTAASAMRNTIRFVGSLFLGAGVLFALMIIALLWRSRSWTDLAAHNGGVRPESDLPYQAAKASLYAPLLVIISGIVFSAAKLAPAANLIRGCVSLLIILAGFICGLYALWSMRRYGREGIVGRALTGTVLNGGMIALIGFAIVNVVLLAGQIKARQADELAAERIVGRQFPVLQVGEHRLTNVVVTRCTKTELIVTHESGMQAIALAELDPAVRAELVK